MVFQNSWSFDKVWSNYILSLVMARIVYMFHCYQLINLTCIWLFIFETCTVYIRNFSKCLKQIPKVTSILVLDFYQRARHNW